MLNPQASEYIPISLITPCFHYAYYYAPSLPHNSCNSRTFAFSPYPNMSLFLPPQSGVPYDSSSFVHRGGNFLAVPQAEADVTPPSDQESLVVAKKEKAEVFPRVISGRKYVPRPPPTRRRGAFAGGVKLIERWGLRKHGIIPLKHDEREKTTIMIKNIPYSFTRLNLMEFLDKHCMEENLKEAKERSSEEDGNLNLSAYDFLYLPIDFGRKKNKGYAFVNFTESRATWKFFHAFNGTKWNFKGCPKIIRIVCARIQGKEALVKHFEKTHFECESDEYLPACFNPPRDGSRVSVELTTVGHHRGAKSLGELHY